MKPYQGSVIVCLAVFVVLGAGCVSFLPDTTVPPVTPTIVTTPFPVPSSACGFTTCHGLDLACGTNPPQVCTMEYQLGDTCRQFAYCITTNSTCQLGTTPQYDTCRSCIQKCGGADPSEIFSCEEKC
jgi:hypothetical protein